MWFALQLFIFLFVCANRVLLWDRHFSKSTYIPVTSKTSLLFNYVSTLFTRPAWNPKNSFPVDLTVVWDIMSVLAGRKVTKVSDILTASIFGVENDTDDSGNMFLLNYGKYLPDYMTSRPRKTMKSIVTAVITLNLHLFFKLWDILSSSFSTSRLLFQVPVRFTFLHPANATWISSCYSLGLDVTFAKCRVTDLTFNVS